MRDTIAMILAGGQGSDLRRAGYRKALPRGVRAHAFDPAELLNTRQAAKLLSISEVWLKKLRASGAGPSFQKLAPNCIRYRRIDLMIWIGERARAHRQPTPAA